MPVDFAADLSFVLEDAGGVPVTCGAASGFGVEDAADEVAFRDAGMKGVKRCVLVQQSVFGAVVAQGASVTVSGAQYVVRLHERLDDGSLIRLYLAG